MHYSASTLTAAERPVVIAIGRARASWLGRRWTRVARTWTARPISTPQMLRLEAARQDPVASLLALAEVLGALFPVRWWHRLTGRPVALLLRLPDDVRTRVLAALFSVPGLGRMEDGPLDPVEELRRTQRAQVYGAGAALGPHPTLATAALTVRAAYGDGWYYNPGRWRTADGYAPFAVTWLEYVGLQALEARQRMVVADGYTLAMAKDGQRARRELLRLAYPTDQPVH